MSVEALLQELAREVPAVPAYENRREPANPLKAHAVPAVPAVPAAIRHTQPQPARRAVFHFRLHGNEGAGAWLGADGQATDTTLAELRRFYGTRLADVQELNP